MKALYSWLIYTWQCKKYPKTRHIMKWARKHGLEIYPVKGSPPIDPSKLFKEKQ